MALTLTQQAREHKLSLGGLYAKVWKATFDSSYPTGGEALTAANLGFSEDAENLVVLPFGFNVALVSYDAPNEKLLAYFGNYDLAGDGILIEVANTTDLSTLTGSILVLGKRPT